MLESMRRFKAGMFRALAHPTRVAIVEYLQYGEMTVLEWPVSSEICLPSTPLPPLRPQVRRLLLGRSPA
jgi:hypothetical protein